MMHRFLVRKLTLSKFVFEDVYSWETVTYEYHENWTTTNSNDSTMYMYTLILTFFLIKKDVYQLIYIKIVLANLYINVNWAQWKKIWNYRFYNHGRLMGSIFVSRLEREMQGSWIWCNFSIPVIVKQKFRWWWNLANGILISLVSLSFTDYFFIRGNACFWVKYMYKNDVFHRN